MEKSINSPISDDYSPKAETAQSISNWTNNSAHYSGYVFSVFLISPPFSYAFIVFALCYYNHFLENGRIKRIKEKLSSVTEVTKDNCKNELQNEYLLSLLFVIYAVFLSILGMYNYSRTATIIDNEYTDKYYKLGSSDKGDFATSIIICTLILDIIIILIFVTTSIIILCIHAKLDEITFWKFCAYSMIFPFCILANHFHYIVIAFIHDVYHATGVAFVYGILIITVYEALVQLPKIFEKCRKCPSNDSENNSNGQHVSSGNSGSTSNERINSSGEAGDEIHTHQNNTPEKSRLVNCDTNRAEQPKCKIFCKKCCNYYLFIFIAKIGLVAFLVAYFVYNILIYHYLPINKALDDAANHLIGLYQAIAVFFAAVAAYLFFNKEYTSPISIFTKAEYEEGVFSGTKQRRTDWETFSAQKKDNEMAKEFLKRLKKMTEDNHGEE